MIVTYADTSALARAYFADEADHDQLRRMLLEGDGPVITSELARVELAGVVRSAERSGRLRATKSLLERIDLDCSSGGPVTLLRFDPENVIPAAGAFVLRHRLRTLDSLHLATAAFAALTIAAHDAFVFVTRDRDQGLAAAGLGMTVQ